MSGEVVDRVLASSRYRDVDRSLVSRLVAEELPRSRNAGDAVKRVKRRLHQAVGAFRNAARSEPFAEAWSGDLRDAEFRAACLAALGRHASTRERIPFLDRFYAAIWRHTGTPGRLLDIGCGLNPLTLPWMDLSTDATYLAWDVDRRPLATVSEFLELVGQPNRVVAGDAVAEPPMDDADVALLLKLVTTLDRQDATAASGVLAGLQVRFAVVSFPRRTLGGRDRGMERTYRDRLDRLIAETERVTECVEASIPTELVFVLTLHG